MKKARLEAETGANPGDSAGGGRGDRRGGYRSSRRRRRSRGNLSHARNVQTFATSSGAPGRPPVTPREVTSSPLFSDAFSTRRHLSPGPWPGSCLTQSHAGEFRDICPERHRGRGRCRGSLRRAPGFVAGVTRRAAREFFARSGALAGAATSVAPFLREYVGVVAGGYCPARRVRKRTDFVIQSRTYCVEEYDELAKRNCVYRGVAVPLRDGTAATGGNADPPVGCFLQGRASAKGFGGASCR